MCKKFVSYLVIFSLLYSNALYAGNGGIGGMSDPQEPRASLTIRRQQPHPSHQPLSSRPEPRSLQNLAINDSRTKNPPKPTRKKLDLPQIHQPSTPTTPSVRTHSLLQESSLDELKEASRSPQSSESGDTKSGDTKSSLDKTTSPDNSMDIDLNSSGASAESPSSRETDSDLKELKGSAEALKTGKTQEPPTETSALLSKETPPHMAKNLKPREPLKRVGAELRDDESDSDGIKLTKKSPAVPLETGSFDGKGEGTKLAPPLFEGTPQDKLQEVTDHPLAVHPEGEQTQKKDVAKLEPVAEPLSGTLSLAKKTPTTGFEGDKDPGGGKSGFLLSLDDKTHAYLLHVNYLIEGKPTWMQFIGGGLVGVLTGLGVGNGMPPILMGGFNNLGAVFYNLMKNNNLAENAFISHTAITLGIDSQSRNIRIVGELFGPSTEEFSVPKSGEKKLIRAGLFLLTYTGAGTAGWLPVYYLWDAENAIIKKDPTFRTNALIFFGFLSPTLWLDTTLMIARPIKNWIDQKINNICINQIYGDPHYVEESQLRKQKIKQLEDLMVSFKDMTDAQIRKTYAQLFLSKEYAKLLSEEYNKISYGRKIKQFFSREDDPVIKELEQNIKKLKVNESIRVVKVLDEIHKNSAKNPMPMEEDSKDGKPTVTTLFQGGLPLLATPLRSLILGYSLDFILNSLGWSMGGGKLAFTILAGQVVGSFFQGAIEFDTIGKALVELSSTLQTVKKFASAPWETVRKALSKAVADAFYHEEEEKEKEESGWCSYIWGGVKKASRLVKGTSSLLWKGSKPFRHGYLYLQASENALPYMLTGINATRFLPGGGVTNTLRGLGLSLSGLAEVLNNKVSFTESYGDVYDYFERVTYTYFLNPPPPYMKKRSIKFINNLHVLHQTLHPDVVKDEVNFR